MNHSAACAFHFGNRKPLKTDIVVTLTLQRSDIGTGLVITERCFNNCKYYIDGRVICALEVFCYSLACL